MQISPMGYYCGFSTLWYIDATQTRFWECLPQLVWWICQMGHGDCKFSIPFEVNSYLLYQLNMINNLLLLLRWIVFYYCLGWIWKRQHCCAACWWVPLERAYYNHCSGMESSYFRILYSDTVFFNASSLCISWKFCLFCSCLSWILVRVASNTYFVLFNVWF